MSLGSRLADRSMTPNSLIRDLWHVPVEQDVHLSEFLVKTLIRSPHTPSKMDLHGRTYLVFIMKIVRGILQ